MSTKYPVSEGNKTFTDIAINITNASIPANAWTSVIASTITSPNLRTLDFATISNTTGGASIVGMRIINTAASNRQIQVQIIAGSPNATVTLAIGGATGIGILLPVNTVLEIFPGVFVSSNGTINTIVFKDIPMADNNLFQIFSNTAAAVTTYTVISSYRVGV